MYFLNHCYVDTEVEMKEIYASNHMWTVFERSFLPDMNQLADRVAAAAVSSAPATGAATTALSPLKTTAHRQLARYVCNALMMVVASFFGSPFSSTAAAAAVAAGVGGISVQPSVPAEEGVSAPTAAVSAQQQTNATSTTVVQVSR